MPRTHAAPPASIALLRGINVGGKHKLPMADLAAIFRRCGCTDVQTYIQSGNVVFQPPGGRDGNLAEMLEKNIEEEFGFAVPVVIRSRTEWTKIVANNPFLAAGHPIEELHIVFLADKPAKSAAAVLDPGRSPGDSFRLVGRELYLHLPRGVARTKLTSSYLDVTLATVGTMRNWKTVAAISEMVESARD